jgi:prolyl-tRNA synthetase
MQDGKALQCGTSHYLGQNFAKAFDIKFLGRDQAQQHAYTTSWGVSTRLIGAMIMAHSDDEGLVLPPNVAPIVATIVPIFRSDEERATVRAAIEKILEQLVGADEVAAASKRKSGDEIVSYFFSKLTNQKIVVDWRDARPGDKQYHWEQRGVPFRIEVGPRDVQQNVCVLKRRVDRGKETIALTDLSPAWLSAKLAEVHEILIKKARDFRDADTRTASSYNELKQILVEHGGFIRCYFEPDRDAEAKIKAETKATVRCVPFDQPSEAGVCIFSGRQTKTQVLFAQAY